MDCIFCKIALGEISSQKVYEDEKIPKEHISSADELNEKNSNIVGYIFEVASKIAKDKKLDGYRIINNCGKDGGQSVNHLHFHLLGGKKLDWTKL